jgi:predicted nuclease of predicted toxin-antitoxin system
VSDAIRFLLDEDLPPAVAVMTRSLGLDVVSVHEIGRTGLPDEDQLRFAASESRILVTRNRDDFIALTLRAYATNAPHHGVLIVPRSAPNTHPERIARAVAAWAGRYSVAHPGSGFVDFL